MAIEINAKSSDNQPELTPTKKEDTELIQNHHTSEFIPYEQECYKMYATIINRHVFILVERRNQAHFASD